MVYDNEWFYGAHYIEKSGGHYAFAIYGLLQHLEPYNNKIVISLDAIRDCLGFDKNTRDTTKHLKDGLKFLLEHKMVGSYTDFYMNKDIDINFSTLKGKSTLFLKIINKPQSRFTLIKDSEFDVIAINNDMSPSRKFAMLCYFSTIVSHINKDEKVSYPKMELLMKEAKIGRYSTCTEFNNKLVELGVLIYGNAGVKSQIASNKTGERSGYVSNTYARPENEFELQERLHKMQETNRANHISEEKRAKGNKARSIWKSWYHANKRLEGYINTGNIAKIEEEKIKIRICEAEYKVLTGENLKRKTP